MTKPIGPFLGGVHLDDGVQAKFKWTEESGISEPAPRPQGSIKDTFGGPYRINPDPTIQPSKDFDITGYLTKLGGQAEGYARLRRMYDLSGITAGTVTRYQIGSLFVRLFPNAPEIPEFKSHSKLLYYAMTATAVPGTWEGAYAQKAVSSADISGANAAYYSNFGVTVSNDVPGAVLGQTTASRNRLMAPAVTSGKVEIWNPGTAPCPLVMTIEFNAGRTAAFYLKVLAPGFTSRRIVATPEYDGVAVITLEDGLFVPPKNSVLRIEEANGSLITATIYISYYGTKFRFSGITEEAGQTYDQEWPVLYNSRPTEAYYQYLASTSTTTGVGFQDANGQRVGTANGVDTNVGHILECSTINRCLYSQDLSNVTYWTQTGVTTVSYNNSSPNGGTTAYQATSNAADSYVTQSGMFGVGAIGEIWTFSVWLRTTAGTNTVNIYAGDAVGSSSTACAVTTTWTRFSVTRTMQDTAGVFVQIGGGTTWATGEILQIWGCQFEEVPVATGYVPTTIARQRDADVLAMLQPEHNLLAWSNRFDKSTAVQGTRGLWYTTGTFSTTRTSSPQVTGDAYTWTGTVAANAIFEQAIPNAEAFTNRTIIFSIWIKTSAGTSGYNGELRIMDGTTARATKTISIYPEWTRYVTAFRASNGAADYDLRVQFRETNGGSRVFQVFGAQVTYCDSVLISGQDHDFFHANPYVDTKSTPKYPDNGMSYPTFMSQNGYIQFDARQHYIPGSSNSPATQIWTIMDCGSNSTQWFAGMRGPFLFRSSAHAAGTHTINAELFSLNNADLGSGATVSINCTPSNGTVFDGSFCTYRIEWQNYLVAGVRTIRARLIITKAGTTTEGAYVSAAAGHDRWAMGAFSNLFDSNGANSLNNQPVFFFMDPIRGLNCAETIRNLSMGTVAIPDNATPEPY